MIDDIFEVVDRVFPSLFSFFPSFQFHRNRHCIAHLDKVSLCRHGCAASTEVEVEQECTGEARYVNFLFPNHREVGMGYRTCSSNDELR